MQTHDEMIAAIAAHKAGKRILARLHGHDTFTPTSNPVWDFACFEYTEEKVPVTKRVPLGPEDFKPGCSVRRKTGITEGWHLVTSVGQSHVVLAGGLLVAFPELINGYEFTDGRPCWKEVES